MEVRGSFDKRPPVHPGREDPEISGPGEQPTTSCGSSIVSERLNTPPLPLPRRGHLERRSSSDGCSASLGFEPEGGSNSSSSPPPGGGEGLSTSPPNYLEWAKSFQNLLDDELGRDVFKQYLTGEGRQDLLGFWFACEGLRAQTDQENMNKVVKAIYKIYLKDSRLGLSNQCMSAVLESIHSSRHNSNPKSLASIFDAAQQEVDRVLSEVWYRNFLQSEIYLNYISIMNQDSGSRSTTGSSCGGHSISSAPDGREASYSNNENFPASTTTSSRGNYSSSGNFPTGGNFPSSGNFSTNYPAGSGNFPRPPSGHDRLAARASSVPSDSVRPSTSSVSSSSDALMSKSAPNASSLLLTAPRGSPKPPDSPPLDMVSDTLHSLAGDLASSLPTLPEDTEDDEFFDFRSRPLPPGPSGPAAVTASGPKLTKDLLLATMKKRTMFRSKPEAFAGMFLKHGQPRANPYSLPYNSYNPVSRHDSDIQSLSSDARSGSDLSLNTSGLGGPNTLNRPSKHNSCHSSNIRSSEHTHPPKARSIINKEENLHNIIIPRTFLKSKETTMAPAKFAELLITKLTAVKRDRDTDERLLRTLNEGPIGGGDPSAGLSSALSDRFPNCPDEDQDILDQHIESVDDKIGLSPGFTTPSRPKSPTSTDHLVGGLPPRLPHKGALPPPPLPLLPKAAQGSMAPPPPPHQVPMTRLDYLKHTKHRDRDGNFSMFTSDSGNVQDMTDGTETLLSYGNSSCYGNPANYNAGNASSMSKSKSMPDHYGGSFGDSSQASCSRQGSRRFVPKRSDSQIFDSGISGISYSTNATSAPPNPALVSSEQPEYLKNKNVAQWLMESSASSVTATESKNSSTCTRLRHTTTVKHKSGSRSCSSERPLVSSSGKMHPYVTDPSMPPLNPPHTFTQLEEVSRRLLEKDTRPIQSRFKPPTPNGTSSAAGGKSLEPPPSPGPYPPRASLGVNLRPADSQTLAPGGSYTTVVFTFCDEQYPYRTKIPSASVTLKQFKDYLPKKGNFRFFFKTECEDVDTKVIQEEIVDDNEVLPLWEGKVMGKVKPLENENMGQY